jgi:hypothetical protein
MDMARGLDGVVQSPKEDLMSIFVYRHARLSGTGSIDCVTVNQLAPGRMIGIRFPDTSSWRGT